MQWVILGWLEAIKFVNVHTELHYSSSSANFSGQAHVADFAHRARLFYDRVSTAYSNKTCGGGMVWDSTDAPYKNAVTNELYVAASVSMYLYLPGDNNPSPSFIVNSTNLCLDPTAHSITGGTNSTTPLQPVKPRNSTYLQNAVDAFVWLTGINMTNTAGLYVDGFHLTNTTCDQRSEDVFSYNQGVLLSGIRGLWEATGNASYLNYGHNLIHSTIVSTGYSNNSCGSLGCNGVMADTCDSDGSCSQDEQTFKGAYFHHLMLFCAPLPYGSIATILENQHAQLCGNYSQWIQINAAGAYSTKNSSGDFGGAWGASADVNGLGRGRTVETQGGAISVFNTLYAVISNSSSSVHRRA
ncbi:glycoside hydrolase family 76 protein, partial [Viridothelium virens]